MHRFKKFIYHPFMHAWRESQSGHSFGMFRTCPERVFKSFRFHVRTEKGRSLLQFFRDAADKPAVLFRLALAHVPSFKRKPVVDGGKRFSGSFPPSVIAYPLRGDSLAPVSGFETAVSDQPGDSAVVHAPQLAEKTDAAKLTEVPEFHGIADIHAFNGFHSFYDFLRKTFFHTRYVLVTGKDTKNVSMPVYNLSVAGDESYVIPLGIVHNCRCTVVQVRKGKYPVSDEREAMNLGSQATAGKYQEMFMFNPGKRMATFPAYNAYTIRRCNSCEWRPDKMKLAADIPDNEVCRACRLLQEMRAGKERLQEQRKAVRQWAKENLVGKTVLVQGIQNPVEFTSNGIKEALNQPHKFVRAKNEAVYNLINLLKDAKFVLERPDEKGNPMVMKYHYLRIRIADEDSFAVIRELVDGRCQFYSIVEKLKKRKESD